MPISCPDGKKPRFRVKHTEKGNVRLAFCDDKAVEAVKLKKRAKRRKKLGS